MRKNLKTAKKVSKAFVAPLLTAALLAPAFLTIPRASLAEESSDKPLNTLFSSDYDTENAVIKAEAELNLKMATEGSVLLKNKNNALPLKSNEKDITVFHTLYSNWDDKEEWGYSIDYTYISGGGSGCVVKKGSSSEQGIYKGLKNNGFNVNPVMKGVNDDYMFPMAHNKGQLNKINGPDVDFIKEKAGDSFASYSDAAVITISRQESEAADITSMMTDDDAQNGVIMFDYTQEGVDHYLQLNTGEKELIKYAKENFKKVVVLLNTPCPMEVAGLEDDDDIDAMMWIGFPGYNGLTAIGDMLSGKSQPSGKTVDIWANDMSKDPTWQNFGYNVQTNGFGKDTNIWILDKNGNRVPDSNGYGETFYSSVDYEEGIYLGYKFYETASDIGYFDATQIAGVNDLPAGVEDRYYNRTNGVTYPFGYGLTYTTFSQEIVDGSVKTSGDKITFNVKVTNTGNANGKEVVQVYFNPPYTEGEIEKATANLVAFAKTSELKPGASENVEISFDKREMAAYDYNDANKDGHKGYELEAGKYEIAIKADSHNVIDTIEYEHATKSDFDTDSATGKSISNKFSAENGWFNVDKSNYSQNGEGVTFLTRAEVNGENGFVATFPEAPKAADLTLNDEAIAFIKTQKNFDVSYDEDDSPWVTAAVIPEDWTQASAADIAARKISEWSERPITDIELSDMKGIDFDSEEVITKEGKLKGMTGKEAWTKFMNQLSYEEMVDYVSSGQFKTPTIWGVGNPGTSDGDGPAQFKKESLETDRYGYGFACGIVLASSWNTELAEEYGKMIGEWGIRCGATGWYGPSVNIHRSPLGGRNFEYLSEDGLLAGKIAAGMVKGAASKGMITYMKHFALNSQEAERHGVCEWTNEQALREIYFKPFEIAVKEGGSTGMMCSFNRVGGVMAGTNYNLMVELLENEWGFKGAHVTDFYGDIRWPGNALIRCHIFPMGEYEGSECIEGAWDETDECVKVDGERSDALWYAVRTTSMHMLYTTSNSNAMGVYRNFHLNHDGIIDLHYTFYQGQTGNYKSIAFQNDFEGRDTFNKNFLIIGDGVNCSGVHGQEWHNLLPGIKWHCAAGDTFIANVDQETGMFTTAGHWEFTLVAHLQNASGEWYENGRAKLIFDVISAFEIDEASQTAIGGKNYDAQVELVEGSFLADIESCSDPNKTLPKGLKVDSTGHISGVTNDIGEHHVKLLMNGTYWFEFDMNVEVYPFEIDEAKLNAKQGAAYEAQIEIAEGAFLDEITTCEDVNNTLPKGLSVDNKGKISGVAKESGVFNVSIAVNGDYNFEYTLTVDTIFETAEVNNSIVAGRQYDALFTVVEGAPFSKIETCADPDKTLPEGLTVDNSGRITGRTDELGKHEIKLLVNGEYWLNFTLEVKDGIAFRVKDGFLQARCGVDDVWSNVYAMEDLKGETGVAPTVTISEDGYWVINGEKTEYKAVGTDGKDGKDGENGKDAVVPEGGCNGTAELTGVAVGTVGLILAAVAVQHVVRRKKED